MGNSYAVARQMLLRLLHLVGGELIGVGPETAPPPVDEPPVIVSKAEYTIVAAVSASVADAPYASVRR